jgi:hypothetical protein
MKTLPRVLVCLMTLLVAAPPAWGDARAEREARALFREANRLFKANDFVSALEMFRASYAKHPSPKIFLNIGTTLRHLGREAEAADAYERFLREAAPDKKTRGEVEKVLGELDGRLGKLRFEVNEPGARVLVDGKQVGESPRVPVVRVDPGSHVVTAEKQGLQPALETLTVEAGATRTVTLRLVAVAPPPTERTPDAAPGGAAPRPAPEVKPSPARGPTYGESGVPAPKAITPEKHLATSAASPEGAKPLAGVARDRDEGWRPPAYAPWVALGVALVAAGVGTYFSLRVMDPSVPYHASRSPAVSATACFTVAGVAAAGAGGLWLWRYLARPKRERPTLAVTPGGVALSVRF